MLTLLLASTLAGAPIDLVPKRRTELTFELEAFDARRPSFAPGAVAMGFGVAASVVALMLESARHDTTILPKPWTDPGICGPCVAPARSSGPTGVELGFALSAAALTLAGSLWELYVGVDRMRTTGERDELLSAISSALP